MPGVDGPSQLTSMSGHLRQQWASLAALNSMNFEGMLRRASWGVLVSDFLPWCIKFQFFDSYLIPGNGCRRTVWLRKSTHEVVIGVWQNH